MKKMMTAICALFLSLASPVWAADGETSSAPAAQSSGETADAAASDGEWTAFLTDLLEEDSKKSATSGEAARASSVGIPTPGTTTVNPLARLGGAGLAALLLLGGLFVHPRTRRILAERLGQGSRAVSTMDIGLRSMKSLGSGQRLVALEVEGSRLLVGVSQGRMDLLHSWSEPGANEAQDLAAVASIAPANEAPIAASNVVATHIQTAPPARAVAATQRAVPAIAPSAESLMKAWAGASAANEEPQTDSHSDRAPDDAWWLEGASLEERTRIEEGQTRGGIDVLTETVLAKVNGARIVNDISLEDRTGPGRSDAGRQAAGVRTNQRVGGSGRIDRPARAERPAPPRRRRPPARAVFLLLLGFALPLLLATAAPALSGASVVLAADGLEIGSGVDGADAAFRIEVDGQGGEKSSNAVRLLVLLTLLAFVPALVLSMTSFTRLIVVFSLMRQALGVQQAPPNQILIGLALFLTWFIMGPTFNQVHDRAVEPYFNGALTEAQAVDRAMGPMQNFMLKNTRKEDLGLFLKLNGSDKPKSRDDLPVRVLVPAFIISELKTAFQIGFLIYMPFLVIDIVVATVLLAMGMMVLPPVVISLPFKLLLFVFVDGWNLLVGSMVQSFA